jgi:hypothetical protein
MKASIQISTGLLIGSWSPSDDDVMMADALRRGIAADDVELRDVTDDELNAMIKNRDDLSHPYTIKRAADYPPINDFIDGMVKTHSSDPDTQKIGSDQIAAYCDACLAVKLKYPK